ncbi:sensor histidine kinase [Ferruginibacter sp. SUN002]|uniref:sensor histidine kinase n=1 Tax=Ferruginibacter sp. SUN002 TaxID=2937789 RepID=UPI003D36A247
MFSGKNFSPQQLSALTAIALAIPIALGIYFFYPVWWVALTSLAVIFLSSYGLILFMVQKFVYRKIKLIYKLIYQTKASKREEFYYKSILPQKSIDDVREDVEEWAIQRKEEIELLKKNEAYRKEFLQNLSHEFKTPIFAIQGYVDILLNGALDNAEVNKKFLTNASRNVDRLVNLVDDLDEISKLEMGQLKLSKSNFVIQDLIKDVFESLSIKAEQKQLRLVIKKGCEFPLSVFADKEKIRQVLINLIDNAIKYGKQNGEIEASAYKIDGKQMLIEISDDGEGIGEEHLDRIFERFYRTDLARSRKVGGSGLGLAICKHIIEAHNQTIHVRSTIDVGTTFGFTLENKKD